MGSGRWALWILFKIKIIYYISKLNKCIIVVNVTTGTFGNMAPSIPSWAYAGRKLFLEIKCK